MKRKNVSQGIPLADRPLLLGSEGDARCRSVSEHAPASSAETPRASNGHGEQEPLVVAKAEAFHDLGLASGADEYLPMESRIGSLEYRLLSVGKAVCAKVMNGFGAAGSFLHTVSERSFVERYKFVPRLLALPCFKISNLFFCLAYAMGERQIRMLGGECVPIGFFESIFHPRIGRILQAVERRNKSIEGLNARCDRLKRQVRGLRLARENSTTDFSGDKEGA